MLDPLELTGRSRAHVVQLDNPRVAIHREAVAAFADMCAAARAEGIEIAVFSGFRDFNAQCAIWNRKFRGERPLLDAQGVAMDRSKIDDVDVIDIILRWSALPGASRHHWGTDLDLYDQAAVSPDYRVQLIPQEYAENGVFSHLNMWMGANAGKFGFFRPYAEDLGAVLPEAWHWSYAPVSAPALEQITPELVAQAVESGDIEGKSLVLPRLPELFQRYVLTIAPLPAPITAYAAA